MAARTSSAEPNALVESAPATTGVSDYLQRWKVRFEGTDWVPWLILALAAFLRFFLLGIKPPHFDEGINGWFVDQVMKNGFYRYDPTNYHGPLHFYVLLLFQSLFGRNLWAIRLPVVLVSIACVWFALKFEPFVGKNVSRIAALAMAISPGFVFYGRYAIHEVTRHETLATIAKQYGTSTAVIAKVNDVKGGKVAVGDTLKIPEISGQLPDKVLLAASRVDRPQSDGHRQRQIVYRVRAGETLSSIARRHGMPVSTLAHLNNMGTTDTLVKGQRLVIKASSRRYREEGTASGRRVLYVVRRGDTVYSISRQFQVTVPQLKSWNGLNQHHQIKAGQRLVMYVEPTRQQG